MVPTAQSHVHHHSLPSFVWAAHKETADVQGRNRGPPVPTLDNLEGGGLQRQPLYKGHAGLGSLLQDSG